MKIISFNLSLNAHTNDHQTQSPIDLSHHAHTELSGRRRSKQKNERKMRPPRLKSIKRVAIFIIRKTFAREEAI